MMQIRMACSAKCDQIFFAIVAGVASEFLVMNFQVGHPTAELASVTAQRVFTGTSVQSSPRRVDPTRFCGERRIAEVNAINLRSEP
jgi:hypothetical protein